MNLEYESNFPAFENRDFYVDLGEHIAYFRKKAKLTQEELAKQVNISRCYLSRIESSNSSQSLSLELLFNISRALNVPPHYFFKPFPKPRKRQPVIRKRHI